MRKPTAYRPIDAPPQSLSRHVLWTAKQPFRRWCGYCFSSTQIGFRVAYVTTTPPTLTQSNASSLGKLVPVASSLEVVSDVVDPEGDPPPFAVECLGGLSTTVKSITLLHYEILAPSCLWGVSRASPLHFGILYRYFRTYAEYR